MAGSDLADIKYASTYLTEVIARIDFLGSVQEISQAIPRSVANLVAKSFPILEPRKTIAQEFQISPPQIEPKGGSVESTEWKFHGQQREKFLAISPSALLVKYTVYSSFEHLSSEFLPPTEELFRTFPDLRARRLGLRYINNIDLKTGDPFSWGDYLDKRLLCALDLAKHREYISRAFHTLEVNFGDLILRFQYGMHNPDYPARIRRRLFVLDFDAYSEQPASFPEIAANISAYHDVIQAQFEASISDPLRKLMNA